MALVRDEYCRVCEATKPHINRRCPDCAERARREALAVWQSKTPAEQRLDLHKRLLRIEARPAIF